MDRAALIAIALAACASPAPAPVGNTHAPDHVDLEIAASRTPCLGRCPEYSMVVRGDGDVHWRGLANVAALGERHARVPAARIDEIDAAIARARFFERDEDGHLPKPMTCDDAGSCSFEGVICSDASSTRLDIHRGPEHVAIDDAHCEADPLLDPLERLIERIAVEQGWLQQSVD